MCSRLCWPFYRHSPIYRPADAYDRRTITTPILSMSKLKRAVSIRAMHRTNPQHFQPCAPTSPQHCFLRFIRSQQWKQMGIPRLRGPTCYNSVVCLVSPRNGQLWETSHRLPSPPDMIVWLTIETHSRGRIMQGRNWDPPTSATNKTRIFFLCLNTKHYC